MEKLYKFRFIVFLLTSCLTSFVSNAQSTLTISGPTSACVDDVLTYILTPSQPGAVYSWSVTSQGSILNSGSSAIIQWISAGNATIIVQELDAVGAPIAQGSLNVTITPIPLPNITVSSSVGCTLLDTIFKGDVIVSIETSPCIKVCANSAVTYSVENQSGATYTWFVNGDVNHTISGNTCTVNWGDAGWGNVSVQQDQGSCTATDSICVKILARPTALFETMPEITPETKVCLNSSILFIDQSTSSGESPITSWVWDFGDGTVISTGVGSAGNPLEHSYDHPGSYTVSLVVIDACGCAKRYTILIVVSETEGIKIECPRVVCESDIIDYTVNNATCNQAFWSVSGGHILSQDIHKATVKWDFVDDSGFGYLTYNNECGTCPENLTVKVPVIQQTGTIQGPTNVCADRKYLFSLPQWPSTEFNWSLTGNGTLIAIDQPNVVSVLSGTSGTFDLTVRYCNTLLNCEGEATLHVTISPEASIVGASVSCINETHTYGLSNGYTATWKMTPPSGTPISYSGQTSISPAFNQSGTYTLEIQGNFCAPDPFQIRVHPKPTTPFEISGPTSTCVGIPVQYSASPHIDGTTFQWSTTYGTASPEFGSNTFITFNSLPSTISVIRVTSDEAQCASDPLTQVINSTVPPSISITTDAPNNLTICGSTQWHFDVDYTDGDLYQWKILDPAMGSIVSGNYSPNIEVLFNNPSGTSEYVEVIVAVTKCNEIKRDTLILEVINGPEYTVTPGAITICANEPLSFSISPTPVGYDELTWEFGDGISSDQPNPTHSYSSGENVAQYTPVATIVHPGGCLSTAVMQAGPITVKPAPVAYVSPGHMVGCGPFSTTLSATVSTGFGSTTNYEWHGPTTSPPPPNCASCNTWDINAHGSYYVVVENSNGCRDTSNTVHIIESCGGCPNPKPYLVASDSSFIDCGIVQANIQYHPNGLNVISETWTFPDQATNTSSTTGTNATATATFEEAGVYITNYLVDDGTCVQRFVQTVYVPFIGDMRYTASCGSGNLYDVTLFDHSNIYPSEVGHIEHTYAYKNGSNPWQTIIASLGDLEVTVQLPPGNYQLREIIESNLTTGAPACTTLVSVNLPDKPHADFQIDAPFIPACINDVIIHLDNQSTPATDIEYLWDFGDISTNYQQNPDKVFSSASPTTKEITLTATNTIGCVDAKQSTIQIEDNEYWDWDGNVKPTLSTNPSPPQCYGTPITLTYFNSLFPLPPSYTWYQESVPITPLVSSGSFDVTQSGVYWVMGSDTYGCLVPSKPAMINFTQIPTPIIVGNHEYCDNTPFSLTSSLNMESGVAYSWERTPGGIISNDPIIYQSLDAGTYEYILTVTKNGCEMSSAPFTVTVADPIGEPTVSFGIVNCQPYEVKLTATHPQSGTFNWSNGGVGPDVTAYAGGPYKVTFTSPDGCISESYVSVPKSPEEYLWIFPTGCFCAGELDFETKGCSRRYPGIHITGPIIRFSYWSYLHNGNSASAGSGSIPLPFADIAPSQINLLLDNGYCHVESGDMYYSQECPNFGPQGLAKSGDANTLHRLGTPGDQMNQDVQLDNPLLLLIPNPATNQTRIQYQFDNSDSQKSIEIFDMTGRKIKTLIPEHSSGTVSLSLNGYVAGIYEICLKQDGRIIAQTKLAVTH